MACQSRMSPSGPFTTDGHASPPRQRLRRHGVQLVLRFRCRRHQSSQAHLAHVSTLSGPGTQPVSGQLSETTGGGAGHRVPVSCCLSATGIRFLGHPVPAGELGLPHGRPTGHVGAPDPNGVSTFRTLRDTTGVGAPYTPGTAVLTRPAAGPQPAPAASQRPVPAPRRHIPSAGLRMTRHQRGFTSIHPSGLPLACGPRMERAPLGLSPELRTPPLPATHVRAGTGLEHAPGTTPSTSRRPSNPRVHSQRATSCRNEAL